MKEIFDAVWNANPDELVKAIFFAMMWLMVIYGVAVFIFIRISNWIFKKMLK